MLTSGVQSLCMPDHPERGMFWVQLSLNARPDVTMFVTTAHLPWKGCATEVATGVDQRRVTTALAVDFLRGVREQAAHSGDVLVVGGDFNDDWVPTSLLREGLGLQDVFEAIDCPPPSTHPTRPSHPREERQPDHTLDWIMTTASADGKGQCRVLSAHCKRVRGGTSPPPSDHMPVLCVCELTWALKECVYL